MHISLLDVIGPLLQWPWLALLPAAYFGAFYRKWRFKWSAVAAAMWLFYAVYEYGMKWHWLCSGACDIRIDLLLIYPVMLLVTLIAAVGAAITVSRRRKVNAP